MDGVQDVFDIRISSSLVVTCLFLGTVFQLKLVTKMFQECCLPLLQFKMSTKWWQTFRKEQKRLAKNSMRIYLSKVEVKLNLMISKEILC